MTIKEALEMLLEVVEAELVPTEDQIAQARAALADYEKGGAQ